MLLLVGLGNPGKQYAANRHNVGFMALERLREEASMPDLREKFSGVWTKGTAFGAEVAVLLPRTFMNLSGDSVQPAAAFLKVESKDIVVVHDELDVPFGEVRLKMGGGHAGHNGLRSIILRLGTPEFLRVRIGVGRPPAGFSGDVADYVLSNFDTAERAELPDVLGRALAALDRVVREGPSAAMNAVNVRPTTRTPPKK